MTADSPAPAPGALRFVKMHGLGNDFVVLDGREEGWRRLIAGAGSALMPAIARRLGDRRLGVGCDQLALIEAAGAGHALVGFWNADGSPSATCGNATRCVAWRLMAEQGSDALEIVTGRGRLRAERTGEGSVRVNMGPPILDWRRIPLARAVDRAALPLEGTPAAVGMGNPHCVFVVDDAEAVPLTTIGPRIETDPLFPERTNVEFVQVLDRARLRMRVWERGRGVTPACGSGACAAAVVAAERGLAERRVVVDLDGGALEIDWRGDGVWMAGPVAEVFEGVLSPALAASLGGRP